MPVETLPTSSYAWRSYVKEHLPVSIQQAGWIVTVWVGSSARGYGVVRVEARQGKVHCFVEFLSEDCEEQDVNAALASLERVVQRQKDRVRCP